MNSISDIRFVPAYDARDRRAPRRRPSSPAPDSWRRGLLFSTSAGIDNTYAETLVDAAVSARPLARY